MNYKLVTNEAYEHLFCALQGISPPPLPKLTEAEKEAREKARLMELCHWEIRQAREQELVEQLARALGLPVHPDIPETDLNRLYRTLVS